MIDKQEEEMAELEEEYLMRKEAGKVCQIVTIVVLILSDKNALHFFFFSFCCVIILGG
jgi:hypothetical protein